MPLSNTPTLAADLGSKFLEGFSPLDLKVILAAARLRHFTSNSVIVNQGNPADCLFLLTKGRARFFFNTQAPPVEQITDSVRLLVGRSTIVNVGKPIARVSLTSADIADALVTAPNELLINGKAAGTISMFVWDRATLRNLAIRFPRVVENVMLIGYDYLGWYVAAHVALVSHTARERLAGVLTCLAQAIGEKVAGGFEFDATNEELAGAANVTAFTASRLLGHRRAAA